MITGKVASIESMGLLDGPGIRTVVFMQGCILRCAYCHNPALLTFTGGKEYTPNQLFNYISKFKSYYGKDGGVTVSGGEPLAQTEFLIEFFKICKNNGISTCLDTSGVGLGNVDELLKYTDLVLLDIKHVNKAGFKELTEVDMDKTIPFMNALSKSNCDVWIRQVILPNYNDNMEYLTELAKVIKPIKNVKKVEFLPYNNMAEPIYELLNMKYRLKGVAPMNVEKCNELLSEFLKIYKIE